MLCLLWFDDGAVKTECVYICVCVWVVGVGGGSGGGVVGEVGVEVVWSLKIMYRFLKGLWHGQNYAYSFKHELQT